MSDHQHESPISTPKQLITVVILAFVIPIALIGFLVAYVTGGTHGDTSEAAKKPESVAERIKPVAAINLKDANAPKVFQTGEQVFKGLCISCHGAPGIATAPKLGDVAAWAPRLKDGLEGLTREAIKGNAKGMPAKGGNPDLDDYEVALAVAYMANASGAKFKEPAAPAPMAKPAEAAIAAAPAAAAVVIPPPAAAAPVIASAAGAPGKALYDQACTVCHAAGVANAPKFGDKAAWAPRIAAGIDAMTQSVIKGKGAMPPKGTAMAASDADLKAAVTYMVGAAK